VVLGVRVILAGVPRSDGKSGDHSR